MDDTQRTGWQKRILLFLTSQCITLFGSTLVQMALVWYATMQTSSGVWVAAFTVCSYLPQFLISFIGGVWADRYHRKKLIIGADLLIAFVTFVMVLAIPHISSEPALLGGLLVMSVIRSLGAGIQTPAVNAVIPQLVPEDQLMRYNGINATMQSIVNFAAPAAAGAVFAISTLRMTLMIDIVTAILGTGLLSCLALPKQNTSIEKASVFSDMKIGVKYAFADKLIGKLLIIYGLFTFFCVPAGYLADDMLLNDMTKRLLTQHGYCATSAYSGSEALLLIERSSFDLILLDLMLPGISGEIVLEKIKNIIDIPIIGVSAKTDIDSKVNLIRNGADDYITKPFDNQELLVRIEAVLRRFQKSTTPNNSKILRFKDLSLDTEAMEAKIRNTPITLTRYEYLILQLLMSSPSKVFTKNNIFESVWNENFIGDDNAINVHIGNLRKKFAKVNPEEKYIQTVWGLGFKMQG